MKRGLKIVISWLCLFSLFISPMSVFGATSSAPVWPNPGATQLSKTAAPTGNPGEWEITLKVEGKNLKTSSDVVLVIDKSGSMDNGYWDWWTYVDGRIEKAKKAANKFVDNLLLSQSSTRIAVVSFSDSATEVSGFKGPDQKEALKNAIDGVKANGGTNIQAGLKSARDLLSNSSAQNKIIVVLSDGEPTYSFKGTQAASYDWPNSDYNFAITKFDYGNKLGTGRDFDLSRYKINKFSVEDNGIGTISEAKIAKDAGLKIFSVGLDVSNNGNAMKVLKDVQSEGYFSASSDELNNIFREMAGKISYAAQDAKVIDPMGDMFNLKMQGKQISAQDYTVSQGTVVWDPVTEKFTWNIGNIAEGEPAIFTYKVVMDPSKNPVSNALYPTNGTTTLEYKDVNNRNTSKDFEVPKVSVGNGSILMKGYKVNTLGKPINAEGVEVEGPEFAELLYSENYKDQNGNEALPIGSKDYSVSANEIAGYQLKVGETPTNVRLTATNPTPVVWYGYEKAVERSVTVNFLEKDTEKQLAAPQSVKGAIGDKVSLAAVDVTGYTPELKTAEYTVKAEGNEYTFYYTANTQSVEVQYLEQGTDKVLAEPTTTDGVTGETVELKALEIPGYTPVEPSYSYTLGVENAPHIFYYTASEQNVSVKFVDKESGNELAPGQNVPGVTGQTVTLKAVDIAGYTPELKTAEYTVKAEGNEYIFYYTANANEPGDNRTLIVRYVDKFTQKDLLAPTERIGKVDEVITLTAEDYTDSVTGAVYKPHTYEAPYTFTEAQVQQFVFEYTQDESDLERSVTIHHVDKETGEALKSPTTEIGYAGKTMVLYPEPITVTDPVTVTDAVYYPEQPEYGFDITLELEQEFTMYYTKGEPTELAQITVSYLDRETGAELAIPKIIKGRIGDKIELTAKEVLGYTPEIATDMRELTEDPNQTYVFYYTKNAPADRQLTVKYLENGTNQQLADPTVITGKPGETKTLTALSISGYTPVKSTDTYTFNDEEGQVYTFYYTRISSNPGGSDNPGNTGNSGSPTPPSTPVVTPLPPLPAVPPTLDTENHYDYIHGYPDGTVKPLNNITREEVATIFYRLLDDESRSAYLKSGTALSDVEATRWSNKYISTMENAGVVTGYPNGTFKPGQYITRAEFAAIASRFDKLDERQNGMFSDIQGHWAEKYIASAANKGWINGYTDGTFKPDQYITRAEAAKFINSVLNRKVDKDGIHEDAKMWPDNIYGMWYYYEILEATNHHEYSREEPGVEVWQEVKPNRVYP
ncbi:S-layer homology domain-containing protein [Paenibacillus macerans]|uniref:S-layer homology domain-containing protein n=1 Tax=Paenibacillus macerans TaxID=44252 RepID=UPI003D315685